MMQIKNPTKEMDLDFVANLWTATDSERRKYKDTGSNFTCFPGTCGEYSSTNYLLLGVLSAQLSGAKHWLEYDQSAFLPVKLRQKLPRTIFLMRGLCREFTDVHAYMQVLPTVQTPLRHNNFLIDNQNMACNSGIAVANALSTGKETAIFLKALLGTKEVLPANLVKEMTKFRWLETGYGNKVSSGQFYGMGLRDMSAYMSLNPISALSNPELFTSGLLLGHDGWSTGGWNSFSAYAPQYDFAFSFLTNNDVATNLFPFIARKTYDITSTVTPAVGAPLQGTYEHKNEFLRQAVKISV
jgi:CubicO group peptidase (beta-lactamase class C family)